MLPTKEELKQLIDIIEWTDLHAHLERGGLIVVGDNLDLTEVAIMIADDAADAVSTWINSGELGKPAESQIAQWNCDKQKKFRMLIISPFVLIQELQSSIP